MPFPPIQRVIYKNNPLVNVICQFRFPPILKIDSEVPSEFQEKIRHDFPEYVEKKEGIQIVLPDKQGVVSQLLNKQAPGKNHEFLSEDDSWKVNLTRTFISLSTTDYTRWELFLQKYRTILDSFSDIYSPPFFTRIGLRYVDIFDRTRLNLTGSTWSDLIQPEFLGLLSSGFSGNIVHFESSYEIRLSDADSIVRMIISIAKEQTSGEDCLMIDADFHNTFKKKPAEAFEKLEFLHERASRLIRSLIKEKLHLAMEPGEI